MSSRNDIIELNKLYVDRVWVKAYPDFFANLRLGDNWEKYRRYREEGIFKDMTEQFFRVYRTINGLKIAFRKNVAVSSVDDLKQLSRFGKKEEGSFEPFVFLPDGTIEVGRLKLTKEQILSLRRSEYTRVDEKKGKVEWEKVYYMVLAPWMRIAVKPYMTGFYPPMIRFFLNGIEFAKQGVRFNYEDYESHSTNWIDPSNERFNFDEFMKMQGYFLKFLKENIPKIARNLWIAFFDREEDLEIKITQVELSYDSYIEKLRLVNALRLIGGKHKTIKYDITQEDLAVSWGNDVGLKYYLTIDKSLQLKVYSKAIHKASGKVLNRFEVTLGMKKPLSEFEVNDLFSDRIIEVMKKVNIGLASKEKIEEIREFLRPFVKAKKPEYRCLHEAFLLDLLIHGQIKGRGVYREIARTYAKWGIIEIQGHGRNSVYVLKPEYICLQEKLRELFGDIPMKLLASEGHPQRNITEQFLSKTQ
jgi:hypothetical protein